MRSYEMQMQVWILLQVWRRLHEMRVYGKGSWKSWENAGGKGSSKGAVPEEKVGEGAREGREGVKEGRGEGLEREGSERRKQEREE